MMSKAKMMWREDRANWHARRNPAPDLRDIEMDDKERYERGMAQRRKVLGAAWVDRANARKTAFTDEFQDFITRCAWGEVWTRPHFDERTRRILVIGTMVALGRWEEFQLHVRAALTEGGFSADDLKEIILQQAVYCGVPAANHAFKEAAEILTEVKKS
jgi:4-carboxymuconolactone decarboxylase